MECWSNPFNVFYSSEFKIYLMTKGVQKKRCLWPWSTDRLICFKCDQRIINVLVVNSFWGRFWGMRRFSRRPLASDLGWVLFIPHAFSIHQLFARQSLCVAFIGSAGEVLRRGLLRPGRIMISLGAWGVLECAPEQQWALECVLANVQVLQHIAGTEIAG